MSPFWTRAARILKLTIFERYIVPQALHTHSIVTTSPIIIDDTNNYITNMSVIPPTERKYPFDPHIDKYWGDFPTTQHLDQSTTIFRFAHLNINSIKYRKND